MTCIAGLVADGRVTIGGDSAGVAGTFLESRADEKVFTNGDFLFGCSGSFRQMQILRYDFDPPPIPEGARDLDRFMVRDFVRKVRDAYRLGGHTQYESGQETGEGHILVAYKNHLWKIQNDFQVSRSRYPYQAVGSGGVAASASLCTSGDLMGDYFDPVQRVQLALHAAARHDTGVSPPFTVLST